MPGLLLIVVVVTFPLLVTFVGWWYPVAFVALPQRLPVDLQTPLLDGVDYRLLLAPLLLRCSPRCCYPLLTTGYAAVYVVVTDR